MSFPLGMQPFYDQERPSSFDSKDAVMRSNEKRFRSTETDSILWILRASTQSHQEEARPFKRHHERVSSSSSHQDMIDLLSEALELDESVEVSFGQVEIP